MDLAGVMVPGAGEVTTHVVFGSNLTGSLHIRWGASTSLG
jgi:hypothetical protein